MGNLTATSFKAALNRPGRHGDGDGLFLVVGSSGAASWMVRVQKAGKRRDIGLGSASKVGLAKARARAAEVRSQVDSGLDPIAERRKAQAIPTFRAAAILVFEANRKKWRNGKHHHQWMRTLETYAFPTIGDLKLSQIAASHVHDLLAAIWLEKPETARRVRQRVGMVLDWGYSKGFRENEAPMRAISQGLPRQRRDPQHHRAIAYADMPAFLARLRERESFGRLALEAVILTAARSGEVRGATWDELDLEKGLWSIPGERMKTGRPHVVPLSLAAKRVFERAAQFRTTAAKFVFQGMRPDKPMSDMTLLKVLRDMGLNDTVHGCRSTFRDWVSEETSFPGDLAEAAIAHKVKNKVEAAYRRGTMLEKRRVLMDAWSEYCDGQTGKVVQLVRA